MVITFSQNFEGLGAKIRKAREEKGLTVVEICGAADLSYGHWYRLESEEVKTTPIETIRKIEQALGVEIIPQDVVTFNC